MTLVQVIREQAQARPDAPLLTFLDSDAQEATLTRGEVDRRARAIAAELLRRGLRGERVLLLYVPGLEFVTALLGCLYAGAIAVPAYPPDPSRLARTLPRLQAIAADCAPAQVLTTQALLQMAPWFFASAPDLAPLPWAASDAWESGDAGELAEPEPDDIAFLQYTSGSTSAPRGVVIRHRNLGANLDHLTAARQGGEHTTIVSWLPFYHDLGLIGAILFPLYIGGRTVLFSPLDFLRRPLRWLEAIHRYGADTSAAPNFALDLCARKIAPADLVGLDLSRWTMALIGAEPIQLRSLDRFSELLAPTGFSPDAIFQGYGLAEGVLASACGSTTERFRSARFQAAALREGRVLAASAEDDNARTLVSCGRPIPGQRIEVVDPVEQVRCAPGRVGEIWIAGPNVADGYWRREEETARTFGARLADTGEGPFLRTGDLGFFADGEIFVAGRAKDLIIIRGKNHHPEDLEQTVDGAHPALRPGCNAAFAVDDLEGEQLVIVAEVDPRELGRDADATLKAIADAVRAAVSRHHDILAHAIALIRPGQLPKTSSGKGMRHACRAEWLAGRLDELGRSTVARDRAAEAPAEPPPTGADATRAMVGWLRGRLARVLSIDPERIDETTSFADLGLDSREAVGLVGELESALGRKLPQTLLYDNPSLRALAQYLTAAPSTPASTAPIPRTRRAATSGRHDLDDRIGIVGGGVAGLTAAWELARLGYRKITVYEREADVGGKVYTAEHRGHPYEFGQMFFTGDYHHAHRLVDELGLKLERNPVISRRMDALSRRLVATNVFDAHAWVQKVLQLGGVGEDGDWLGPAPDPAAWAEPIPSFLKRHDLWPIPAGVLTCWTILGYGFPTDDVPSWYLINYARVLRSVTLEGVRILPGGNRALWDEVAARLERTGVEIVRADVRGVAREAGRVRVTTGDGERSFDAVILACAPNVAATLVEPEAPERAALSSFRTYDYVCTSYEARHPGNLGQVTFDDAITDDTVGALLCLGHHPHVEMVMLAQYGSPPGAHEVMSVAELDERARRGMQELGIEVGAPLVQKRWRMFPHLSPADIRRGVLRDLEARQGAGGLYFAGSYLSFETLEHTLAHTQDLIERCFAPRRAEAADEPIAIVGMGCRFPGGGQNPAAFWRMLESGVDAITEVPPAESGVERFDPARVYSSDPARPGRSVSRWGGFLPDLDTIDADFFGLTAREARTLDPQGRLLLEVSWEALEDAGIVPARLEGTPTGIYMGLSSVEYQGRAVADADGVDANSLLGTMHSTVVGRLSYWLGVQGPNLAVDAACSSSLAAVHLACQALRAGECTVALAGGANAILSPTGMIAFSKLGILSPTGRCRTFADDADGIVRSEGCGVVVLKRLSDAERDGDRILAVLRGSAINQDGRSNGLAAPSGPAQQRVIRRALEQARVAPHEIDYVECHGTGTALGDPIEVHALAQELAPGRAADRPVLLGSAKTHIGHTEAAAGIAGLIKTVLSLTHGRLPRTLHQGVPSTRIAWAELPVAVVTEGRDWPTGSGPRRAGVSSFGVSGTNVHMVVEEAPARPIPSTPAVAPVLPFLLSAQTEPALRAQAARLEEHLAERPEIALPDVAWSLATTRSAFAHRAVVVARDRAALAAGLATIAAGRSAANVATGRARSGQLGVFFPGQGSQRAGMGRQLHADSAVFRAALDEVCAGFGGLAHPLRDVMFAAKDDRLAPLLHQTAYTQPALFAIEVALYRLHAHWGLRPDVLLGHSIGEIVAAHVSGVLSLPDACALVAARGRLMQALPATGAMVAVEAAEDELDTLLRGREDVAIAAVNGPRACVLSGDEAAVRALADTVVSWGRRAVRLDVSHAFHSPRMDPALDALREVAAKLRPEAPRIPIVSNVTGRIVRAEELADPEYWVRQARRCVRFFDGVRTARAAGVGTWLELGPQAVCCGMAASHDPSATYVPTLSAFEGEIEAVLRAVGAVHANGHPIDWTGLLAPLGGRRIDLPTYAFVRQRHFLPAPPSQRTEAPAPVSLASVPRAESRPVDAAPVLALRKSATVVPSGFVRPGRWLLLGGPAALANRLEGRLSERGANVVRVEAGASAGWHTVDPLDGDAVRRSLAKVAESRHGLRGVVVLWGMTETREIADAWRTVLTTAEALASLDLPAPPRLHVVTAGAQWAAFGTRTSFDQALVWSMAGALAARWPRLRVQILDVDDPSPPAEADALARELLADTEEPRVALRGEDRFVERVETDATSGDAALVAELLALAPDRAVDRVVTRLRSHLGGVLAGRADSLSLDTPLRDLGIDSLTGLGLLASLHSELGIRLPGHLLTPRTTLVGLAELVLSRLHNRHAA